MKKRLTAVMLALCFVVLAGCSGTPKRPKGDGVMLTADQEDWGVVPESTGIYWSITFDGNVEWIGYGVQSGNNGTATLSDAELDTVWEILNDEFLKHEEGDSSEVVDGTGWRLTSYDEDGKVAHLFYGRVDGIEDLEQLTKILTGKAG